VLNSFGASLNGKALISIAAGKSVCELTALVPLDCRILRVMPNTPAMIGEGMTALCSNSTFTDEERESAQRIFGAVGRFEWVSEGLIDAVTAVSGSGPAYVFMVIEAMADGGVREGLSRALAVKLAAQTVLGAAKMVLDTGLHTAALRDMVCSPGGTTIDAVYALEEGGLRASLIKAIEVCAEKSRKLSK
jgi:pyrroline-5-carboxylate reductase